MIKNSAPPTMGKLRWAVAEGYIPEGSHGPAPQMTSHEALCILNSGPLDAEINLWIVFSDKDPQGPYSVSVPARRTCHLRLNRLNDPAEIPRDTDYSCVLESSVPVVVQHTRLDSRQNANALMTTMAYFDATAV